MPIASRDSAHLLDRYFLLARKAVSDLPPLALLAVKFSIYEAPHAQARSLAGQEARAEPRRARRARRGAAGRRVPPGSEKGSWDFGRLKVQRHRKQPKFPRAAKAN